ncbi:MAG: uroporphyrinogen decarboxylase family protein [Armatimonadota bacterium]
MTPKENLLRAIRREKPERVPNGLENTVSITPPVVERPSSESCDCFGVHWSYDPAAEGGTYPTTGGYVITDISRWREQIKIPDVDVIDWSDVKQKTDEIDRHENLVLAFVEMGLFERSYLLLGMQEALISYLSEPDLMEQLVAAIADYKIALISRFYEVAKPDIVWYGDDWGTQSGLFMSPGIWRAIIKPHTKRIYDCIDSRGMIVYQHSCGKIEEIFADMVEIGADIWNPCQPCNDLARLKKEFGDKISFHGGIDSQFVLGRPGVTPEEARAEVRKRIDQMGKGGGYIAGPSHGVPYRPEIINAMNNEIADYGRYCH